MRILSRPVPIRIPYWIPHATTAAVEMSLGARMLETVLDQIEGSGNISRPIAWTPARSAVAATSCAGSGGEALLQDQPHGHLHGGGGEMVGIDTGCRRGAPSLTPPPRDSGIHCCFQRRRS